MTTCVLSSKANHTLQRTDESVRCVSVFQWVESISVIHGKGIDIRKHWRAAAAFFFAQAETDTKSNPRLVKHRRAAATEDYCLLAFLIGTKNCR